MNSNAPGDHTPQIEQMAQLTRTAMDTARILGDLDIAFPTGRLFVFDVAWTQMRLLPPFCRAYPAIPVRDVAAAFFVGQAAAGGGGHPPDKRVVMALVERRFDPALFARDPLLRRQLSTCGDLLGPGRSPRRAGAIGRFLAAETFMSNYFEREFAASLAGANMNLLVRTAVLRTCASSPLFRDTLLVLLVNATVADLGNGTQ